MPVQEKLNNSTDNVYSIYNVCSVKYVSNAIYYVTDTFIVAAAAAHVISISGISV